MCSPLLTSFCRPVLHSRPLVAGAFQNLSVMPSEACFCWRPPGCCLLGLLMSLFLPCVPPSRRRGPVETYIRSCPSSAPNPPTWREAQVPSVAPEAHPVCTVCPTPLTATLDAPVCSPPPSAAPSAETVLPSGIHAAHSLTSVRSLLKSHLSREAFCTNCCVQTRHCSILSLSVPHTPLSRLLWLCNKLPPNSVASHSYFICSGI